MDSIKVSISDRERNFCEDDAHRAANNQKELILITRENELDEEKPLDETKLATLLADNKAAEVKCLELGGLKLTPSCIEKIANCGATKLQCLRLYDCLGLSDEVVKLFGQRFGKTVSHLELVGYTNQISEAGVKALIASIGNLEVLHLDNAVAFLADYSGTITNMRHIWSKVTGDDLNRMSQFTIKYAPYLRHLDITLSNTKDKTPEFIKLLANLTGLTKLSITSTSNVPIEAELQQIFAKLAPNLTSLNLCVWCGGDATLQAISQLTKLEQLTLNGRSPMRHIDFRLNQTLQPLAACANLKNIRLILKNHSKNLLEKFNTYLPKLETLELEGLDIDDAALVGLSGLKSLGFLDIVSPEITDAGISALVPNLPMLTFIRINDFGSENLDGSKKIGTKSLDAIADLARKRQPTPIEVVFTENAKIDVETRRSMLPPNLTVSQRASIHLISFPGSTPRGF